MSTLETAEQPDLALPYRSLVGALNFISNWTRPDITHAVSELCRFMSNYTEQHWVKAKHVLRYLAGTSGKGILFPARKDGKLSVDIYSDASYAEDKAARRSRTGFVILLNGAPISWKSTLQRNVILSSAEAEYYAMSDAIRSFRFLHGLITDLKIKVQGPARMLVDNQAAIFISQEPEISERTKHFDVRLHHVRDWISSGTVRVSYIPTGEMTADIMTKALVKVKHEGFSSKLVSASTM
jgi:hypothetical protein